MEKAKVVLIALLATVIAIAIFFAIVRVALVLSTILILAAAIGIIFFVKEHWPCDRR